MNLIGLAQVAQSHTKTPLPLPDGAYVRPFGVPRLVVQSDVPEGWGIAFQHSGKFAPRELPSA